MLRDQYCLLSINNMPFWRDKWSVSSQITFGVILHRLITPRTTFSVNIMVYGELSPLSTYTHMCITITHDQISLWYWCSDLICFCEHMLLKLWIKWHNLSLCYRMCACWSTLSNIFDHIYAYSFFQMNNLYIFGKITKLQVCDNNTTIGCTLCDKNDQTIKSLKCGGFTACSSLLRENKACTAAATIGLLMF